MSRAISATSGAYLQNSTSLFNPSTGDYTYAAWVRILPAFFAALSGMPIISDPSNPYGLTLQKTLAFSGYTLTSGKSSSTAASKTGLFQAGTWQYLAYTYNHITGISSLFLNAVEVSYASRTTGSGTSSSATFRPLVGTATSGIAAAQANVDSIAIWNRVLTPAEIVASMAYRGALVVQPASLVAYWPLLGIVPPLILEAQYPVNTYPLTPSNSALAAGPNSPGQTPPSPVVNIILQDAGATLISLPVPAGMRSEQFIRELVLQGLISPGDGKTLYPVEDVVALVATDA